MSTISKVTHCREREVADILGYNVHSYCPGCDSSDVVVQNNVLGQAQFKTM